MSSIGSIEFGNRTHRKVPVRLPNQSNKNPTDWVRLSSIDFWFGSSIPDSKFQIPVQLRTSPLFLRLASNAFPDIESVGPGADYSWSVGLKKKKKTTKKKNLKKKSQEVSEQEAPVPQHDVKS